MDTKKILIAIFALSVFCLPIQADVWQKNVIDSTGTAKGINCSIALDSEGNPHISYADGDKFFLYYADYDGVSWNINSVDSFGITGFHTSIDVDSEDRPHLSYTAHILDLRYVFWDDTGWVNQVVDSGINPGVQGFRTSLVLDHNDNPHIAYFNDDSGWVVYTTYDGDSWNTEFLQDITGSAYLNLILKDDSLPYIGYHIFDEDVISDTLRIAYRESSQGNWQFETMPQPACPAGIYFQSFDMDSDGNCYFAYQSPHMPGLPMPCTTDPSPSRTIAKFDGSLWSYEEVPNPPGDPFEMYVSFPLYLKFDNNNNPAFLADTILYWKKDGTNWSYYGLGHQMGDEVAVFQQLIFDQYNYPQMVFGQPWVVYYKLFPGDPQIVVPVTAHTYTENYTSWNCVIENHDEAPVIVDSLIFKGSGSAFQIVEDQTPFYIHYLLSDSISIRFMPEEEITYYDTLLIFNNDSANPIVEVALEGTGSFDETTGDLSIIMRNCYASPDYHAINYDQPLAGVNISLYQSDLLKYGPVVSDFVGLAIQSQIEPGTYDLRLEKVVNLPRDDGKANDTLRYAISIDIDTGLTIDTLILPESLMVQSYQWVYDNSHIDDGDMDFVYGCESYAPGNIRDMLDLWRSDLDSNKIESAARLILAQEMVDRMFGTGRNLGMKGFEGISDLLHFSIKATESEGGWVIKILKIIKVIWDLWAGDKMAAVMEILQMLAEYIIIELIDMVIDQVAEQLPNLHDPASGAILVKGSDVLKALWKDIKNNYSNWSLPESDTQEELESSWDHLNNLVYRQARIAFIQIIYIDILTNPKLEKAKEHSETFDYSSDFADASESSTDKILEMKVLADNLNDIADGMITSAQLLMKTYVAMTLASAFLPSISILEDLKTITMYASIGLDVAATGVALGGFFNIPSDMNDAVDVIYHPDLKSYRAPPQVENLPMAKANAQVLNMLKVRIINSVNEYDSILNVVDQHIAGHEIEDAMTATGALALADVNLMRTMDVSTAPATAVAHALYDSMPGFSGLFDSYVSTGSEAGMTRFFNYLSLVQLPADSSQPMKDYLTSHLDTASINNHAWSSEALELLDSVFGIEIPAIVVASEAAQDKFGLLPGDTATVSIRLQNVGALQADSIYIKFEANNALIFLETDSIYVGSLAVGEESGLYKWTFIVDDTSFHRGTWTAWVNSSNAKNYSPDGSFKIKSETVVDVQDDDPGLLPERFKLHQNRPNPFNSSTEIRFDLPRSALVKLEIFNMLGQKVATVIEKKLSAGNHAILWESEDISSGIYFYKLTVDERSESKKMILLK